MTSANVPATPGLPLRWLAIPALGLMLWLWPPSRFWVIGIVVLVVALELARFATLPSGSRRWYAASWWHRLTWKRLARNLSLAYVDRHLGGLDSRRPPKVNYPRARFRPNADGWTVRLRLIPGVGRGEVEKAAEHLGNAWGCCRVGISQPKPGRVLLRAMRRDPLLESLSGEAIPRFDGRRILLGRDEFGQLRYASLANHAGSCWAGNPGRGKTEAGLSLAVQLAGSPLVDTWVLDGGACDWSHFADGAAGYVADDLAAAAGMLSELDAKMRGRRRNLEADLGVRNAWRVGPSADYALQWLVIEEAPFYLSLDAVKGDRKREALVAECRGLVGGLLMRGRAPMFHVSLIAQKPTTTSLPSQIRDLCGLRWSFGVSTVDTGVAALGETIRQYDTLSPVRLQGDGHVGVASVLLATGDVPYTLLRFPAVGEERADRLALELARRSGRVCVACVGDGGGCLRCRGTGLDPDKAAPLLTAV